MRKSLVVELVLLNSALVLSGCTKVACPVDEKKDWKPDEQVAWDDDRAPRQNTCRGSRGSGYHGGGGHGIYYHGGGGGRTTTRPGTGTVGRGGFGSTGHAVS